MDIQVIQNYRYIPIDMADSGVVLDIQKSESEYRFPYIRYYLYDLSKNSRRELLPKLRKIDLCPIRLAQEKSNYFYFVALAAEVPSLYRYDRVTTDLEQLTMLPPELLEDPYVRLKIFVLNDDNILLQKEYAKSNLSQTYDTFCLFEQTLYHVKEQKSYPVVDANLTTNGIEDMIPYNETSCILKTGYNLLEDDRYHKLEKVQSSVESICMVNIKQLISDIRVSQTNIFYDFLEQAFYTTTIPYVKKESGYLIYSVLNNENHEETVTFYCLADKSSMNCINKNVKSMEQLSVTHIIAGVPVVCMKKDKGTILFNLKQSKANPEQKPKEEIVMVSGELFVTREWQKRFLRTKPSALYRFYQYPKGQAVYSKKLSPGHELTGLLHEDGHYYIFCN